MGRFLRSWKLLAVLVFCISCRAGGAVRQASVPEAVEMVHKGEYKDAGPILEQAVAGGSNDPAVVQGLYEFWTRQGQYTVARDRFEAWSKARPTSAPIRLAAARVNRSTGNYAAAIAHADAVPTVAACANTNDKGNMTPAASLSVAARVEKAHALEESGKRGESLAIFQTLIDEYTNKCSNVWTPSSLVNVAEALRATEDFHGANDTLKTARSADSQNADLFVLWGDLLLEKYNEPEAIDSYRDALNINPNIAEAHLGLFKALELTDPEGAAKELDTTFQINPNLITAHLTVAASRVEAEEYDKAIEAINEALKINPQSTPAYSLLAAVNFLRGNTAEYEKYSKKVLEINPLDSGLYYTLADSAVSLRLYKEAVGFARQAVQINPRDWRSQNILGVNLLRLGEEKEGQEVLENAFVGDPFNIWTYNTLKLLTSFASFERLETPHFQVKLHRKESAALRPYVTETLEKAYATLTKKYEFTPEGPITFEMFPDHADFAVRILGMPGIGALGVCFGKVFAMDSPSARPPNEFNWGSTLWHEFTHVITLQMTDHKIPRWFSEGLSVSEERKGFPGWGDDMKAEFLMAIKEKKFLPIADLNNGFIHPTFPEQVIISYYQASLVADFIQDKWGFPSIRKMLLSYKAGRSTSEVFKEVLNVSLTEFDGEFSKWVNARVAGIDFEAYGKMVTEGEEALKAGETDKAIDALSKAIAMYPEQYDVHNPYETLAQAYLKKGDKKSAIETLKKLLTWSETSFGSNMALAKLLEEQGDLAGATTALEGAMYIQPLTTAGMDAHRTLGALLLAQKRFAEAAREFETLLALNAPDRAGAYYNLAEAKFGDGRTDEARKDVFEALKIAPSFEPAQELLLKLVR
ncbi:MAG TPA: tetratricopeptide repeat protein [Terriglobia bacterium]|nr:tetratricopeptide repeat protein [Terriglobia bacterium]